MVGETRTHETLEAVEEFERVYGPYRAAEFLARVGESGRALDALERAQRVRDTNLPRWVKLSPSLSSLHSNSRFVALVERLGLGG